MYFSILATNTNNWKTRELHKHAHKTFGNSLEFIDLFLIFLLARLVGSSGGKCIEHFTRIALLIMLIKYLTYMYCYISTISLTSAGTCFISSNFLGKFRTSELVIYWKVFNNFTAWGASSISSRFNYSCAFIEICPFILAHLNLRIYFWNLSNLLIIS